jgi:glycosyltransferase involved in cell wall biosynthesis
MKLLIVSDAFPPMRTSAAVHMYELTVELVKQGHEVTVIIPNVLNNQSLTMHDFDGYELISVLTPISKDVSYIRRAIAEFITPYIIYQRLKSSTIFDKQIDGIIWYSPTIFFGPLISRLKKRYGCSAYLVLRDMFPDWTVDLGLMKKRLPYYFFKLVEFYQYKVADCIGIQAPGNFKYFDIGVLARFKSKVELLWTWIAPSKLTVACSINLKKTNITGRVNFVYAGNMGVAQGMNVLIDLAERLHHRADIGFLFVGRGSDVQFLRVDAKARGLDNVVFFDEIDSTEIPSLYAQCHIGIVALDPRHKSHNIPGKFLSYMQAGLPVLASINPGNDLEEMINCEGVGRVCTDYSVDTLQRMAIDLVAEVAGNTINNQTVSARCKALSAKLFSPEVAVNQIVNALSS